jgi:hypothetical protein
VKYPRWRAWFLSRKHDGGGIYACQPYQQSSHCFLWD